MNGEIGELNPLTGNITELPVPTPATEPTAITAIPRTPSSTASGSTASPTILYFTDFGTGKFG